jgi:hypothetical protein
VQIDWLLALRRYLSYALLVLVIAAGVAGVERWEHDIAAGALAARDLQQANDSLKVLTPRYQRAAAALDSSQATAANAIAHWQAIADAPSAPRVVHLAGRVDTIAQHDTLRWVDTVTRQPTRAEILQAGNALARACTELSNTCAEEKTAAAAMIAELQRKAAALEARPARSCRDQLIAGAVLGALGGYEARKQLQVRIGRIGIP